MVNKRIGILWDLDGTISDSFDIYYEPIPILFKKYQIPKPLITKEMYRLRFYGSSIEGTFQTYFSDIYNEEMIQKLSAEYSLMAVDSFRKSSISGNGLKLIPGVKDVLSAFREKGWSMAIASSSWFSAIISVVSGLELTDTFDNIISGRFIRPKPYPDIFLIAAKSLNLPPSDCVVFEDSLHGLEAGKKAGMKTVGIASTIPVNQLKNADIALDSYVGFTPEQVERLFQE